MRNAVGMDSIFVSGSKNFWFLFTVILLRYFVLAAIAFVIFYGVARKAWFFKKIQQKLPSEKDYRREILYSLVTAVIFTLVGLFVFASPVRNYTFAYTDIKQYGVAYFWFSIPLMILVHDTYFYWIHRLMHHPAVFRWAHKVHHLSTNPSPWAAMAFHPLEAFLEASVIIVFVFLFPVHPAALGLFLLFMMAYNVYGHLGYELYPKGFSKSRIGKWINTSVNHNMHHQHFEGNYGLYFLWWDRWMGTLRPDYDQRFDEVKSRSKLS